jgi:putative oxidoreductase
MQVLTSTVAKYLFAVPVAIFGLFHFMGGSSMAGAVPLVGESIGTVMVYLTGVALLAASVSMLIGKMDKLSTLLLGVMLIIFALSVHLPKVLGGDQMAMGQVLKDLMLAGGAWIYSANIAKDAAGMPA